MENDVQALQNDQETFFESATAPRGAIGAEKSLLINASAKAYPWGWLPALSLASAFGLLLIAIADTLSRSAAGHYESFFWAGLLLMTVPVSARLAASEPERRERIGLLVMLGLGFYLVKILHSPYGFTFSDELIHSYNASAILETGRLFHLNPILQVTPFYPGLETITAALASLSGLSIFQAGLLVISIARLIAMLALFLFFEKVSGSLRLAGIAALFYTMNANFLFWSAQFSYESLALPLAMWVLYIAVRRSTTPPGEEHRALTLVALLGIAAVVITHHLTSYFLITFFGVWTLGLLALRVWSARLTIATNGSQNPVRANATLSRRLGSDRIKMSAISEPAGLALFSAAATLAWLVGVARITPGYLSPVLSRAANSILQIISGVGSTRALFESGSGYAAPLWERFVGLGSIVLMLVALPFGLRKIWQNDRRNPIALLLTCAGLAYFAMLGLRLSPEAWETGNRASEFLFLGLAFVIALAILEFWDRKRRPWLTRSIIAGSWGVILMGGIIAGWTPKLRLSGPIQVNVGTVVIQPQGFAAAEWMRSALGTGNQVAADESNARLLLAYGGQLAWAGKFPDVQDLLGTVNFPDWQVKLIQDWDIRYIVVDRRRISSDNMAGYYFDRISPGQLPEAALLAPEVYGKFDQPQSINRLFDSGNIVIYETGAIINAKTAQ